MVIRQVINSVFNSCSYVITGEHRSWIVDCGDVEPLMPLIDGELCGVLLTHAHFDHIYGLNNLLTAFPHVPVYTNQAGLEGLLNDKINLSRYHETPFVLGCAGNVRLVDDHTAVNLFGDVMARAVFTPGHCPSCVTWVVEDAVFTGDSFIPGVKTVTILPHADKRLAAQSEMMIRGLLDHRTVYAGHAVNDDNKTMII